MFGGGISDSWIYHLDKNIVEGSGNPAKDWGLENNTNLNTIFCFIKSSEMLLPNEIILYAHYNLERDTFGNPIFQKGL